jgi:hypothetical protein
MTEKIASSWEIHRSFAKVSESRNPIRLHSKGWTPTKLVLVETGSSGWQI